MSSQCGIRKPRREIFDICLRDMNLTTEDVIYIGDTVSRDVIGVHNAGWRIIQIDNPLTYHKDEKYRNLGFRGDFQIENLTEMLPILQSLH